MRVKLQLSIECLLDRYRAYLNAIAHSGIAYDDTGRNDFEFAAELWISSQYLPQTVWHREGDCHVASVRKSPVAVVLPAGGAPIAAPSACCSRFACIAEFPFFSL